MRDTLHRTIDGVLEPVPIFKQFFENILEKGSQSSPSTKRGGTLKKNGSPKMQI